jgi:dihydroflavonol-4-reductase
VTGATGHVGNVLVRRLVELGRPVRAIVPLFESTTALDGMSVEVVTGDVRDASSLERALRGVNVAYHLAGMITISGGRRRLLQEVNVAGTRNMVEACMAAGVRRLVYVSSVHALPEPRPGVPVRESRCFEPERLLGDYARSKALASREVLAGAERGLDSVMVFPSGIIGPFDYRPSEMGQLLLDVSSGRMWAYVEGEYDFVDVRDVAGGLVSAADNGRGGEGYLLSGSRVTVSELMRLLGELAGVPGPRLRLPLGLARAAAVLAPLYYRLARRRPLFTSYSLKVLRSNCLMDSGKARRELGFLPRPLRETVRDTLAWFRSTGRLQTAAKPA